MKDECKKKTEPAYAVADPDRLRRCGAGEVIYGAGKRRSRSAVFFACFAKTDRKTFW